MVNYLQLSIAQTGAPINVNVKMCYNALDNTQQQTIQSYCRTEYATYTVYGGLPSNQSCALELNNVACVSCNVDTFQSTDSFDCSNVESDVVVDNICGGNTIWKQFLADEFPTTEPTGYPTAVSTPPAANEDDTVNNAPTVPDGGSPAPAPTTIDSSPTSGVVPPSGTSSALKTWTTLPLVMGGLLSIGAALN